ncbi:MAG TPA: hemolysin III family protein [Gaiellaceae bacterium]|nr:hemolysin III family protein [Gaiellaceae bacterium]
MQLAAQAPVAIERPLLRGALHGVAFTASLGIGVLLVVFSRESRVLPATVFACSAALMLGTSTLYHRVTWSPSARLWMRRADHAGIFVLIAGTYTPVALISLHGTWGITVLVVVWSGAIAATISKFCWAGAPRWWSALLGLMLGWIGVVVLPRFLHHEGVVPVILLAAGGLAYTAGALVYALKRPDPYPRVFGYHELFHALTIVALACQYVAVAFFVVRVA